MIVCQLIYWFKIIALIVFESQLVSLVWFVGYRGNVTLEKTNSLLLINYFDHIGVFS